jgi:uncharacterized protein YlxW (UPF0749 family)
MVASQLPDWVLMEPVQAEAVPYERVLVMSVRKLLAGTVLVAVGVLGTAGVAAAQTKPSNGGTAASPAARCAKAEARLAKVQERVGNVEQRIDKVKQAIANAQADHEDKLVARLQERLNKLQDRHGRAGDVISAIRERCSV